MGIDLSIYPGLGFAVKPALIDSAEVYVTLDGNDGNGGSTWQNAKRTIPAAIAALPLASDFLNFNGIVQVGYGTFAVASYSRVDAGVTSTPKVFDFLDPSITSSDVGAIVDGRFIYKQTIIESVSPGVGFTGSYPGTLNAPGTPTVALTIHKPAVVLPVGVTLRGRGNWNAQPGGAANYPTAIVDSGNGVTIWGPSGTGPNRPPGLHTSWVRSAVRDISVVGNSNTIHGYYAANVWGISIDNCTFAGHGQWGINWDANAPVQSRISNTWVVNNGTASATILTGGIFFRSSPNTVPLVNVRSNSNYGVGILAGAAVSSVGCQWNFNKTSAFSNGSIGTGVGYDSSGAPNSGMNTMIGDQVIGNQGNQVYVQSIHLRCIGCAIGNGVYAFLASAVTSQVNGGATLQLDGCAFFNLSSGVISMPNLVTIPVTWRNCTYSAIGTNGFIFNVGSKYGGTYKVPITALDAAEGSYGAPVMTVPPAAGAVTLASGTPWENDTGSDAIVTVPVAYTAGSSAQVTRFSGGTTTSHPAIVKGAAGSDLHEYRVNAGEALEVLLAGGATFNGDAVVQAV